MPAREDDALSWDGDDDPTLDVGAAAPVQRERAATPAATRSADKNVDAQRESTDDVASAPFGNVMLVTLGVLAGIYLLYAVGWFIGAQRLQVIAALFLEPIGFAVASWIATLAPAIWFTSVIVLTRGVKAWIRLVLLFAGVVILLPWPFLMVGVGA